MADSDDDDLPVAEILRRRQLANSASLKTVPPPKPVKPSTSHSSTTSAVSKPKTSSELKRKVEVIEKSSNKKSKSAKESPPVQSNKSKKNQKIESDDEESNSDNDGDEEEEADDDGDDEPKSRRSNALVVTESKERDGFYSLKKGFLAQTLLVRWWYAIQWPQDNPGIKPKAGFETLDGFTGVYVSTRQGSLGTVQDTRDQNTCPCLANFKLKKSKDLRDLCVLAIQEQIRQLVVAEGSGTVLESTLKKLLKEVMAVNCEEADREADRFLGKRH